MVRTKIEFKYRGNAKSSIEKGALINYSVFKAGRSIIHRFILMRIEKFRGYWQYGTIVLELHSDEILGITIDPKRSSLFQRKGEHEYELDNNLIKDCENLCYDISAKFEYEKV